MYNDELRKTIITDLERKELSIVNTAVVLASQGYVVNRVKYVKLDWASIVLNAFENINIFSEEQQRKIELLYNKLSKNFEDLYYNLYHLQQTSFYQPSLFNSKIISLS